MFAASLVILMNQFSSLYHTDEYAETMRAAIDIVRYCAEIDPQAARVLDIITRFAEVVTRWTRDHTYQAPPLSEDLSFLYSQSARPGPASDPLNPGVASSTYPRSSAQAVSGPDPGLLTPPSMPKMSLQDILSSTQPHSVALDARVSGMTPPHIHIPPATVIGGRPSVSAHSHSSIGSAEPLSGNLEFEFDGLWSSFINHLPPVSSVAPGLSSLAMQFPPPVIGTPTEPYGACSTPLTSLDAFPVSPMQAVADTQDPILKTSLVFE
jgi:hypothetical protein